MSKQYIVYWWMYCGREDLYADYDELVECQDEKEAITILQDKYPRGKNFKVELINS